MAKYIDLPNLKENLTNFLNKKINPIYAKKTEIPSNVSELNNDKSYQTAEEVGKAVTDGVAKIVAGAPEDFDTLKEMSDWISSHETSAAAMNSAISDNSVAIANHTSNSDIHVTKEEKTKWNKLDSDLKDGTIIVVEAIKATRDAQGNVIDTTYAKKTEIPQGTIVDDALSSTSENAIQNKAVDAAVKNLQQQIDAGGTGGSVTVDSALSTTSVNPVQNKVITAELNKKIETLDDESQAPDAVNFDLDSELSLTSVKGVQNKAIAEEFQKYANGTKVVAKATEANTATTASNAEKVNGHTVGADVPSNAVFTDTVYDDSAVKTSIQNIVNGTTQVGSATKATQDAQGNVINETYAKKTEVPQRTVVDDALSSTSTNPVQNKVVKAEFDKVNSNLDSLGYGENGAYNLINPTLQTTTVSGVTCTANSDGTYTLNGTSNSSDGWELLICQANVVAGKQYKIVGFKNPSSNYWLKADTSNVSEVANNGIFTASSNIENIYINFSGGVTFNNEVVRPMLTENLDATYDDFKPYIPSVKMLAEEVSAQKNDLDKLNSLPIGSIIQIEEDKDDIETTTQKYGWQYLGTSNIQYDIGSANILVTHVYRKNN